MIKGLDYSWARPTGAVIKRAGFNFVVRYIPYPGNGGKGLTAAERDDLRANGLDIAMVFESFANRALQGHAAGAADATASKQQMAALGFPASTPVYFAVDFDAAEAQQPEIDDYLRGAASVLGPDRVGVYAGYWIVKRCHENGTAKWLWQTYAWSGGNVHPAIHIYQYLNGQNVNGSVDFNEAKQSNFGQWRASATATPASAPAPKPAPAPIPRTDHTYQVVSGDTLIAIGRKTGLNWQHIADLNHLAAPYTIYPGQVLHLDGVQPAAKPSPAGRYKVVPGDNLIAIGSKTHTVWQEIARLNGLNPPYTIFAGQSLIIPGAAKAAPHPAGARTYTVAAGDYLAKIAGKFGTSWQVLYSINKAVIGPDPNKIKAGQVLRLP